MLGATPDASGLFANINGVRVKVGDIDTDKLDINLLDGTVTINGLDVTVSGAAAPLLNGILGTRPDPVRHAAAVARPAVPEALGGYLGRVLDALLARIGLDRRARRRRGGPARRCTGRTWSTCPTRTSPCSSGRRGRSTSATLAARVLANGRGGYCFELNTLLAALLRAVGFDVTHHQAVVGGEGPTNHMALRRAIWTASAGSRTPGSARGSWSRCRCAKAVRARARSPTR